jgi:glyoxylase-like metal-dependent hydrolase (beta-lactamase superfamily II)
MKWQRLRPDLALWPDPVCNVYAITDGDAALLVDLGDGECLDRLADIGVKTVEWVLFTHHHREQCRGFPRLAGTGAKSAGPDAERALFERPADFRRMKPKLDDAFTVYGASYVRPPVRPVRLDRAFQKMDSFTWRGRELVCVDTRGNSPGGMSYLWPRPDGWLAFSGDAMLGGGAFHTWFDSEWDYGFAKGLYALANSAALLADYRPSLLLPSHGPVIPEPGRELTRYVGRLRELAKHYVRGYDLFTFAGVTQDTVSRPTTVPHVWQVSPHLYKFKGPDFWPNFTLLLADSGRGLIVDCGLFPRDFLERSLKLMQERLGLKQIDAILVTHMHGDHCLDANYLRDRWGAKVWTHERVAELLRRPDDHPYAAPISSYGKGIDAVPVDRVLRDGEVIHWEGFTLTCDWMPGQTEFACCLHGSIDGRRVAFTGDNIFANPADATQTGHEAVVAHNAGILEEGYLHAAAYLHALAPDLILGGHSWVLDKPAGLIARYREGAERLRDAFRALSGGDDYRYRFDPYWVRAEPFRLKLAPGASADVTLKVRNFGPAPQRHRVEIDAGDGLQAEPAVLEGVAAAEGVSRQPLRLTAAKDAAPGVRLVAFDVTRDGRRVGPLFDMTVEVG